MIVGADVTHPGKGTDVTCPSIAGIVATHDPRYVQYLGSARLQTNKNEVFTLRVIFRMNSDD